MKMWVVGLIIMIISGGWIYYNYTNIIQSTLAGQISPLLMNPFITLLPQILGIIGFFVFIIGLMKS